MNWPSMQAPPSQLPPLPPTRLGVAAARVPRTSDGYVVRLPTLTEAVRVVLVSLGIPIDVAYTSGKSVKSIEDVRGMQKDDRRKYLNMLALRMLTRKYQDPDEAMWSLVGLPGSPLRLPMEYLTALWSDQIREKTWLDALTLEEQEEYATMKRERNDEFQKAERLRQQALAAVRNYMAFVNRIEANAETKVMNWTLEHLPNNVVMPGAKQDPLIDHWFQFAAALGISVDQAANPDHSDGLAVHGSD